MSTDRKFNKKKINTLTLKDIYGNYSSQKENSLTSKII